jgi:alkylation response protein AidB-like acyl-CoA dehydrogenase
MRGNSSRSARLDNVRVPATNLLGREGDHIWYVFEVIAPFFLIAMAGTYIGIAQSALDGAIASLKGRRFAHAPEPLADNPVLAHDVAEMWLRVSRARQLTHYAAKLGDARSPEAVQALFAAKIEAADAAVEVTRMAMTVAGGRAYQDGGPLQRAMRDAQAAPVMSPTTHLLKTWLGRTALGLPPL